MRFTGKNNQYLEITPLTSVNSDMIEKISPSELSLVWFQSDNNRLNIDNKDYTFNSNDLLCLTEFHKTKVQHFEEAKFLRWNKLFYCVINHDSEVGCRGILFYGASSLPVINIEAENLEIFATAWKLMEQEMQSYDNLQEEMLQMILKRILVLCTRLYKKQTDLKQVKNENVEIIKEYNFLVEQHFKKKHTVKEYADLLHKSPKTLSNLFKKIGIKSPSQFIKDRKMLEAKRLLLYSNNAISDIGYELGFPDVQSFSRFFKSYEGVSPQKFKEKEKLTTP